MPQSTSCAPRRRPFWSVLLVPFAASVAGLVLCPPPTWGDAVVGEPAADPAVHSWGQGEAVHRLEDAVPGYSIARCLFEHGRLVVLRGEEFVVLREGDALPGEVDWEVLEISDSRAVLRGRGAVVRDKAVEDGAVKNASSPVPLPSQLLVIEPTADGGASITVGSPFPPLALVVEEADAGGVTTVLIDATTGAAQVAPPADGEPQ